MHIIPIATLSAALNLSEEDGEGLMRRGRITVPAALLRHLLSCALMAGDFDENEYLLAHPDVLTAVEAGETSSARVHYATRGYFEGRDSQAAPFDEAWYLAQYPDVAEAVQSGVWNSGRAHYQAEGRFEWRSPNPAIAADIDSWRRCFHPGSEAQGVTGPP